MTAITRARASSFSIGELSRATGVNIETIRYYERIKMLHPPPRTDGGRRVYGAEGKRVLAFIRRGRELGFTLAEISALLGLGAPGDASCAEVKEIASRHLADVRSKMADLVKLETILAKAVAQCAEDVTPACPVVEILDGQVNVRDSSSPAERRSS